MKFRAIFFLFVFGLTACLPTQPSIEDIHSTNVAVVGTGVALTQTAIPTTTSPAPTPTLAATPTIYFDIPTPMPTEPVFPFITPDAFQVQRWQEYEDALVRTILSYRLPEEVVCEWEILGQTTQEVYVYTYCADLYSVGPSQASIPALIHIGEDGSVQNVEIPGAGSSYGPDIKRLFPTSIQERIFGRSINFKEMGDRLRWRRGHPNDPPFIVLSSMSIQPTQQSIPMISPNSIQIEKWEEYQTALADILFYHPSEKVLCEWEILSQSINEVYVWAICSEGIGSLEGLVKVHIDTNGAVKFAETAGIGGSGFPSEIREMFPVEVQNRYFNGEIHFQELVDRLRWRQTHREEQPWIVISTTPTP